MRPFVIGAAVVVMLGAGAAAFALSAKHGPTLQAELTAAEFGRNLFPPPASGSTTHTTANVEISLGSNGSITETQEGVSDLANNEEELHMTETLNTPDSSPFKLESIETICFAERCYASGNVNGFPVTGTTGAKWLAVDVPKLKTIANPLAVIGQAFKGTVHEAPLPKLAPSGAAAAYMASGSFTFEQMITALSSSLPHSVTKLASNSRTSAVLSGMTMSFHNAIVVVSPNGALVRFDTPLAMTVSAAAASALGGSPGSLSYSGELQLNRTNAAPLHLFKPPASTVTTSSAVKAAADASS
jgi:hypothetical protein